MESHYVIEAKKISVRDIIDDECNKIFSNDEQTNEVSSTEKSYDCRECGKHFNNNFRLRKHITVVHNNIKQYMCREQGCHYRTVDRNDFRRNSNVHGDHQTNLTCYWPECQFATYNASYLRRHIISHKDDRPYECQNSGCGMRFRTSDALKYNTSGHPDNKNKYWDEN